MKNFLSIGIPSNPGQYEIGARPAPSPIWGGMGWGCYNCLEMSKQDKESKRSVWQPSPTMAERKLWKYIRRKQVLGVKFRRQMAIDRFIVDLCSPSIRLVIEIDGPTHDDTVEADAQRQARLEALGFEVIRFTNRDVLSNIEGVLEIIYDIVGKKNQL